MRASLEESTANYISLERLINVDFRKKYELPVFLIPQKRIAKKDRRNDPASFWQTNELIGYQNLAISVKFGLNVP